MSYTIVTVSVDNAYFSYDADYTYCLKSDMENIVQVGMTVKVPFGKANKLRDGIIVAISTIDNISDLKYVYSIGEKVLTDEMICLALWLKERCFCTTFECLKLMLPRGFGKIKDKSIKMAKLSVDAHNKEVKLTKKQIVVYEYLKRNDTVDVNKLCKVCNVGKTVVDNLSKYGLVDIYQQEIYRNPYSNIKSNNENKQIILSSQQNNAFETYKKMFLNGGGNGLLFGVTGSGKTQVYLKLIDCAIDNDKDVIVMVPEISLTPQTLEIFHKRYGNKVAVFHSGLSVGERNDEYKRAERGEAKIVIGTRSAVFAPLHNLGLIIMDEEQEHTYKSDRTPKYNAKDVANFRAKYNKALFLMTSATPSIESYSAALKGKYTLCELTERYGNSNLPEVITVDMKDEMRRGNKSPISSKLKDLLQCTLDENKQAILLINRRGYNTFIACNDCGHVITCPNCSISLTYHSYNNKLQCHYCGYTKELDNICPECNSDAVRYSGYGTQRIEDELQMLFPDARILRMDADTTGKKFAHEKLLNSFSNCEYDILIGTQMVAKGLDFDNVTLVGVVNADNSLYDENYTAGEKSFDLITQVVGRAGRRNSQGRAVIQTINPFNETLEFASQQDYKGFYNNEIMMRKLMIYPPYCDIYSVTFVCENENNAALCSKIFFEKLVELNENVYKNIKLVVLGPTVAKISKINNNYRYRLALKCKNSSQVRALIGDVLRYISKIKDYRDVKLSVDLNPNDIS